MSSLLGGIKQVLVIHAVCLWQPEQPVGTGKLAGTLVYACRGPRVEEGWRNEGQEGNNLRQSGSLPLAHF